MTPAYLAASIPLAAVLAIVCGTHAVLAVRAARVRRRKGTS